MAWSFDLSSLIAAMTIVIGPSTTICFVEVVKGALKLTPFIVPNFPFTSNKPQAFKQVNRSYFFKVPI